MVSRADVNDLLSRDVDVLVDELLIPFERVSIRWDEVTMTEPAPAKADTTDFLGRHVARDVATTTFKVPVDGDALMLTYRSHNGAPMEALDGTVRAGLIEFTWIGDLDADQDAIRQFFDRRRNTIESFLRNNNNDVDGLNRQMRDTIRTAVERRRRAELDRRTLAARLPFPIERRPGATRPVAVLRKQVRLERRAPAPTFRPEPALEESAYEEILSDCVAMATVFERTPSVEKMEEEEIRNIFLGMLNTNYTGLVGGELFNGAGKTDICIRVEDRNVFIGECKFYDGPKTVSDAIDQILSYLVWRDTKASLLLFVRGGNFTQVVERAAEAIGTHPQCRRRVPATDPTRRSDYVFTRADDEDRFIRLALLPFQLRA